MRHSQPQRSSSCKREIGKLAFPLSPTKIYELSGNFNLCIKSQQKDVSFCNSVNSFETNRMTKSLPEMSYVYILKF